MSSVYRANRKATDEDIIRLNSVGLSLGTIAKELGCHSTTVSLRLDALKIPPANTRRTFMEGIYFELTPAQRSWLESQLGPEFSIRDFVKHLLVKEFMTSKQRSQNADS